LAVESSYIKDAYKRKTGSPVVIDPANQSIDCMGLVNSGQSNPFNANRTIDESASTRLSDEAIASIS